MSLSYHTRYGYASLIEPSRLFDNKEEAKAYDRDVAIDAIIIAADDEALGAVASGDGSPKLIAALKWLLGAHEDVKNERLIEKYRPKLETPVAVELPQAAE